MRDRAEPGVTFVLVRGADPRIYGGERSTLVSAIGLVKRGFRPRLLVTSDDDVAQAAKHAALACEIVPVHNPFAGLRALPWRGRLKRLGAVLRVNAAVWRGRERIVHTSLIHGFYCSWLGARLSGSKTIYHVRTASQNLRTRWFEELAVLLADRTIAVSDSLRDQLVNTGRPFLRPLLARRIRVVYNGFDFDQVDAFMASHSREEARASTGLGTARVGAVLVGGVRPDKCQLHFIEQVLPRVIAAVPSFHVTFVGGAQDEKYAIACQEAVDRLGLKEHVHFTGYLDMPGVFERYRGADMAVLPSEREGLPRAGVEAQAFGLPLVATAVVGNVDVVREGATGFLVDAGRIGDMVDPLVRLALDSGLRKRMSEAGMATVRARFPMSANIEGIERIYRELLA